MVAILVAPNGARKTTADIPTLPVTPASLAQEARRCLEAGASLFHLHVRDDQQRHSLSPRLYQHALGAIRAEVGDALILQITTECVGLFSPQDMIESVRQVYPEAFSVGVRELIPDSSYAEDAKIFLYWAYQEGIQIQYILYSDEDVAYFSALLTQGVIPQQSQYFLLYVLGKKTGVAATVEDLTPFLITQERYLSSLPLQFAVCAFGPQELDCMLASVAKGGHVRIGFENNHLLKNGHSARYTADLVTQFCNSLPVGMSIAHLRSHTGPGT